MFIMIPKIAAKELAPKEDQGVIFGIITAPANATIDDTIRYADAAGKVFHDVPDTRFTFQITFPDNGFGGMVLKPWGVRKTPTKDYLPVVQQKLGGNSRHPNVPDHAVGASRARDNFPVSFVIASTADPERILEFAQAASRQSDAGAVFQFGDIDTKIDQPQAQIVFDHDKVAAHGSRHAASRRRSLGQHRRQLRQPVQHRRPQLQSDSADQTRRSPESASSWKTFTSPGLTTS